MSNSVTFKNAVNSVPIVASTGHIRQLPREMLLTIFSFISRFEIGNLRRVCKSFKEVLKLPSIESLSHALKEVEPEEIYLSATEKRAYLSQFLEGNKAILIAEHETKIIEIQGSKISLLQILGSEYHPVCESRDYLFVATKYRDGTLIRITCLERSSGQILFHLVKHDRKIPPLSCKTERISHISILNDDPLSFLTIYESGLITKWELKDKNLIKTEEKNPFMKIGQNFVINSVMPFQKPFFWVQILSHDEPIHSYKLYVVNLCTGTVFDINNVHTDCPLTRHTFCVNRGHYVTYEFKDNQLLAKFTIKETGSKILEYKNILIWSRENEIEILNAQDGCKIQKIYIHDCPLNFILPIKVRLFGNLLFLLQNQHILTIDLRYGSYILNKTSDLYNDILDCYLESKNLFLLIFQKDKYKLLRIKIDEMHLKKEEPMEPVSEQVEDFPKTSKKESPTAFKIALLVLPFIALLTATLSFYFGISGSINVSIGLGSATLLLGAMAGYAGYKAYLTSENMS